MADIPLQLWRALLMSAGMFWQVAWSLVLGFLISAILQAVVSTERISRALGRDGWREIALATAAGAASSSCSYASAAISRSLLQKGAALIPSLAFILASTNLVAELGIVLYMLMGWQFMAAEWLGGVVLVVIMTFLVKLTYPEHLVHTMRKRLAEEDTQEHGQSAAQESLAARLGRKESWVRIAQNFRMDWSMLWKDLLLGFLIAGALAVFVPEPLWQALFVKGAQPWLMLPANALLGPLVAMLSFVCSIGNVPVAAVLWGAGVSFGGVLAFLYADLIVLPLLDVYRRYYGWKMAAYIGAVFYATMVLAALAMDLLFTALGWTPQTRPALHAEMTQFSMNYTFWLNLGFGAAGLLLWFIARRHPAQGPGHCEHHGAHAHGHAHHM